MLTFVLFATFGMPAVTLGLTTEQKTELLDVTKEVILNAAEMGLEEAGTRLLGPTAWRFFKQAANPVFDRLKHQYPTLFSGKKRGTPEVQQQARNAANAFEQDRALQSMLITGFANLEKGQEEILKETRLLSRQLERTNSSIGEMSKLSTQNFNKILLELENIRKQTEQGGPTDVTYTPVRVLVETDLRTQQHWEVYPNSQTNRSYYLSDGLVFENLYRDNLQALYPLKTRDFTGFVKTPARIELSFRQIGGLTNQYYGLMLGGALGDASSAWAYAYTFSITTDGCYVVEKYHADKPDKTFDYGCDASPRRELYAENNLRLDITGRGGHYYLNGRRLGTFTASDDVSGFIGVWLGNPQQKVLLRNIRVSELGPSRTVIK